jgi:hypothetical protein
LGGWISSYAVSRDLPTLPFHLKFGFGSPLFDLVCRRIHRYAHNDTFDIVPGAAGNL